MLGLTNRWLEPEWIPYEFTLLTRRLRRTVVVPLGSERALYVGRRNLKESFRRACNRLTRDFGTDRWYVTGTSEGAWPYSAGTYLQSRAAKDARADGHRQLILSDGPNQTTLRSTDTVEYHREYWLVGPRPRSPLLHLAIVTRNVWRSLTRPTPPRPAINYSTKLDDHATYNGRYDYNAHDDGEDVRVGGRIPPVAKRSGQPTQHAIGHPSSVSTTSTR